MSGTNLPYFLGLSRQDQRAAVEAMIFTADETITLKSLYNIIVDEEPDKDEDNEVKIENSDETEIDLVANNDDLSEESKSNYTKITYGYLEVLINEINDDLISTGRPYRIVDFAGGYQFATMPQFGGLVQNLIKTKTKRRLSQAALETLSIIAYKQPITKPEIEQIRGVNSNEVVNSLIEKNFVKTAGRKEALGKPLLYAVTSEFMKAFGLKNLHDLPKLRELDELAESAMHSADSESDVTFTITTDSDEGMLNGAKYDFSLDIPSLSKMNNESGDSEFSEMQESDELSGNGIIE